MKGWRSEGVEEAGIEGEKSKNYAEATKSAAVTISTPSFRPWHLTCASTVGRNKTKSASAGSPAGAERDFIREEMDCTPRSPNGFSDHFASPRSGWPPSALVETASHSGSCKARGICGTIPSKVRSFLSAVGPIRPRSPP